MKTHIRSLKARQILDSRGRPTVEVDVYLNDGTRGRASVPSGASTGSSEAFELRDGDPAHYAGLGVKRAVAFANSEIAASLEGMDVTDQAALDRHLVGLDGTTQLRRLGANAILATSLAACRAAAKVQGKPLYRYIAELSNTAEPIMPMPMVNILSGGLHAGRGMDVQDFLAIPAGAHSIEEAIEMVGRVRAAATSVCACRGLPVLLADEGGLSPGCPNGTAALRLMLEAFEEAGLQAGRDVVIAIDVAATALYDREKGTYVLAREGREASSGEMIEMVESWINEFPIVSIEDPLDEEDWAGWAALTGRVGDRVRLIGDDFFTTNQIRVARGIDEGCANGVLVKVNQNGTLSGALAVIDAARKAGYAPVVSARSGETEDSFIADLAVGSAAMQIKIGSVRCSDRLAKYNQLLRIEEESRAPFAGMVGITRPA
ncbi:phosphopyruvate hydratase [Caballeronia sp. J97]|uniref:phosphopyruvate hydratase n=1 Tax=Caballeronia sp. J97 TaxID=2805429 RepID=UPI002AAF57F4|nr:phosphopyruvate hydratase [Caballeronia sp. J97]